MSDRVMAGCAVLIMSSPQFQVVFEQDQAVRARISLGGGAPLDLHFFAQLDGKEILDYAHLNRKIHLKLCRVVLTAATRLDPQVKQTQKEFVATRAWRTPPFSCCLRSLQKKSSPLSNAAVAIVI